MNRDTITLAILLTIIAVLSAVRVVIALVALSQH